MERKQFEEIQTTINKLQGITELQRTEIATDFADMLDTTYKKFNYPKFMDACLGVKQELGLQAMAGIKPEHECVFSNKALQGRRKGGIRA